MAQMIQGAIPAQGVPAQGAQAVPAAGHDWNNFWNAVMYRTLFNKPSAPQPTPYGQALQGQGVMGFGNQMQGAMNQMAGMNLANAQASQGNKAMQLQWMLENLHARTGLRGEKLRAKTALRMERSRNRTLGNIFGQPTLTDSMGLTKRRKRQQPVGPQFTSDIGQGIAFNPQRTA